MRSRLPYAVLRDRDLYRPCPHCGALNVKFKQNCRKCGRPLRVSTTGEGSAVVPPVLERGT